MVIFRSGMSSSPKQNCYSGSASVKYSHTVLQSIPDHKVKVVPVADTRTDSLITMPESVSLIMVWVSERKKTTNKCCGAGAA
jgi:hypothetical protein